MPELDKVADDRFTATVEVKVGPIGAPFQGPFHLPTSTRRTAIPSCCKEAAASPAR